MSVQPRPAASLVLSWSDIHNSSHYLVGRRSAAHRFMPLVFVFPGGRVDEEDVETARNSEVEFGYRTCGQELDLNGLEYPPEIFLVAAYRELEEETGLRMARDFEAFAPPFLFARATTPASEPIRYDTLFFCQRVKAADKPPASLLDVSENSELEDLQWVNEQEFQLLDTAGVTRWVFANAKTAMMTDEQPGE